MANVHIFTARMSPLLKNKIKKLLSALGVNITQNQRYDAQSLKIMHLVLSKDSNCIDIGAHKGEVLDEMISIAPRGTHFAFEPIPSFFKDLEQRYKGKAIIHNLALSDKEGSTSFQHVVSNPAYSGMKQRAYQQDETIEEIKVNMARLDDVIDKNTPIDFIKIDVEGAEMQVLLGAEELIKRNRPVIIFEHGKGASEFYGTTPSALHRFLKQCGLDISLMKVFLADGASLTETEFIQQYESSENYYFVAHP